MNPDVPIWLLGLSNFDLGNFSYRSLHKTQKSSKDKFDITLFIYNLTSCHVLPDQTTHYQLYHHM